MMDSVIYHRRGGFMQEGFKQIKQNLLKHELMNNIWVINLLKLLLIILIIWSSTKIFYLFTPIADFISFFAFPVIGTGILYYLCAPMVISLARKGVDRRLSIWIIFIILAIVISWGIAALVPIIEKQSKAFVENMPEYLMAIKEAFDRIPLIPPFERIFPQFASGQAGVDMNQLIEKFQPLIASTFGSLGSVIGTLTTVVTGLVTLPVLLYYMLLEGYKIFPVFLQHIPPRYREMTQSIFFQSHHQIGRYVRGQIIVAITVGLMFTVGYSIIGLDYAITLGVLAAFLNVIPYIGSIISAVPALIIALVTSPFMLIKCIIVIAIENLVEGRLIQPQILGSNLKIHPVTILVVLLGAGRLFGLVGVILGVPAYAVIKVIVTELYRVYRSNSSLYDEAPHLVNLSHDSKALRNGSKLDILVQDLDSMIDGEGGLAAEDQVDIRLGRINDQTFKEGSENSTVKKQELNP